MNTATVSRPDREKLAARLRGDILDAVPDDNDMQNVLELAAAALAVPPVHVTPRDALITHLLDMIELHEPVRTEVAERNADAILALAVPPVVNEAKLAEVLSEHADLSDETGTSIKLDVALRVLVERQREWLA